ncbi:hypothetical protein [Chryseosolibacter indicus]|uniref:Secreted protein n=1 Tax=Chryseosolibacter indicus TaxID=2782351 RepID=A0ABS5VMJ2_9BACT|nr:hypothetical protein [Chryseosolibacter indicus]MBT1702233.1 hypothetical protein [Chryseosolibacter indicus]
MIIRYVLCLVLSISSLISYAQTVNLPCPKGWSTESFKLPVDFAPNIPYSGIEELRFSPGWGTPGNEELWSYCYLWWIDGEVEVTASNLKNHLEDYYNGLVSRNVASRKIETSKVVPTKARFKQVTDASGNYFVGTVSMLDYMSEKPIVLNIKVNKTFCKEHNKEAVFFSISPQSKEHRVWKELDQIWAGFQCSK